MAPRRRRGAQQRSGLGAMDGFEQLRVGRFAFAFEIGDLAADHAADGAAGGGEFGDQARLARVGRVELGEHLEGEGEQRIAGEDRHGVAEDFVVGELAAAVIVVIERGQIVVDQRVGVDQLERAGGGGDARRNRRRRRARPRCREWGGCACRRRRGCSAWRGGWFPGRAVSGGTRRSSSASTSRCCWAR